MLPPTELPFDIFRTTLTVVVPLPDNVHDVSPEQKLIIVGIFKEKVPPPHHHFPKSSLDLCLIIFQRF